MPSAVPSGHAYFLVGPTAAGKTDAAHRLARELECDLLSADSMLVYRGMDIGTAKPSAAQRREVRYRGVDLVEPGAPFSLAQYRDVAISAARDAAAAGRGLVVAGGTGLYIRCLLEGLDEGPRANPELRSQWGAIARERGIEPLARELKSRYPALFESLPDSDRANARRLIRALELGAAGIMSVKRGWGASPAIPPLAGLSLPSPLLRARIEARVARMYREGLLDEVRGLLAQGLDRTPTAFQAIGYAEAASCVNGELTEAEACAMTIRRTWQLARRQMTWFRHQVPVCWIEIGAKWSTATVAKRVRLVWDQTGPAPLALPKDAGGRGLISG